MLVRMGDLALMHTLPYTCNLKFMSYDDNLVVIFNSKQVVKLSADEIRAQIWPEAGIISFEYLR